MIGIGRLRGAVLVLAALALVSAAALPQGARAQPAGIDPAATKLLKAATDFLAAQKQFSVEARNSLEVVLTSGQKIQFNHTARQSVQRPNKLRAERTGDLVDQVFYYDGKTLSLSNGVEEYWQCASSGALQFATRFRPAVHWFAL